MHCFSQMLCGCTYAVAPVGIGLLAYCSPHYCKLSLLKQSCFKQFKTVQNNFKIWMCFKHIHNSIVGGFWLVILTVCIDMVGQKYVLPCRDREITTTVTGYQIPRLFCCSVHCTSEHSVSGAVDKWTRINVFRRFLLRAFIKKNVFQSLFQSLQQLFWMVFAQ